MKTITIELTEDEANRIVYALGVYAGEMLKENPEAGKDLVQSNSFIVQKISKAKTAAT